MKKIKTKSKRNIKSAFRTSQVNKLIIRPLARRIKQHRVACFKQGRRIIKKLQVVEESVELVAREIARQIGQGE